MKFNSVNCIFIQLNTFSLQVTERTMATNVTAGHLALMVRNNDVDSLCVALQSASDPNAVNWTEPGYPGRNLLSIAIAYQKFGSFVHILAHQNLNVNACHNSNCVTPLHEAVSSGNLKCVIALLQHPKIDPTLLTYPDGTSALWSASKWNQLDMVRALLDHPKTARGDASELSSPLFIACSFGHADVVRTLLKSSIVEKSITVDCEEFLIAIENGHADVVEVLMTYINTPPPPTRARCEGFRYPEL